MPDSLIPPAPADQRRRCAERLLDANPGLLELPRSAAEVERLAREVALLRIERTLPDESAGARAHVQAPGVVTLERLARALSESMTDMVAYWDASLCCQFANAAYGEWFSRSPAEMDGITLAQLLGPELYALNEPYVLGALRGAAQRFERKLITAAGARRQTLARYIPDIVDGRVLGFFALVSDVTEIVEGMVAKARLSAIVDSAQDAIVGNDRADVVTSWNDAAEQLFGYTAAEAIGKHLSIVIPPDKADEIKRIDAITRAGRRVEHFETERVRKDGTRFPVSIPISPIWGDGGGITGESAIVRDITQRRRDEQHLRLLEKCLATLNDIVVITEAGPLAAPGPRIVYVNDAFERRTGFRKEEVIGQSPRILQGPDTDPTEVKRIGTALREWRSVRAELVNYRKSGEPFWLELDIVPVADSQGTYTHWVAVERDITERKRAEENLRSARARLRFALDAADMGEWDLDLRTNVSVRSLRHDQCFGYDTAVPVWGADTFLAHVHPEDRARLEKLRKSARAGRGLYDVECRVVWPDGSIHWLWIKGTYSFDDSGAPIRLSGIIADVSERRRLQESERAASARLQLATDASNTGLWDWDRRTDEIYLSPVWKRQLGYTDEELPSTFRTVLELLHPEDRDAAVGAITASTAAPDASFEQEFRMRHKDGSYRWIMSRAALIRDEDGEAIRMIGSHIDVTSHRVAQAALRDSELRFRSVFEASPVPLALNDEDGHVVEINAAFTRLFGYKLQDIPRLCDWWRCAYPDDAYRDWVVTTWEQRLGLAARSNAAFEPLEVNVTCKDRSVRTVVSEAVGLSGSLAGLHLVILSDVTEQRRLEKGILEATTREQQRLGRDLHDSLGQELTGLSFRLSALSTQLSGSVDSAVADELAILADYARQSIATARRIAHGLAPVELERDGLQAAVGRLIESTKALPGIDADAVFVGFTRRTVSPVVAEATYRILQEALANALRHGRADRLHVELRLTRGTLLATVTDNGRGLAATRNLDGMGLKIMRYRAHALAGRIDIANRATGGVIVRFTCPATGQPAPASHAKGP